jgi:hypothetical protein
MPNAWGRLETNFRDRDNSQACVVCYPRFLPHVGDPSTTARCASVTAPLRMTLQKDLYAERRGQKAERQRDGEIDDFENAMDRDADDAKR